MVPYPDTALVSDETLNLNTFLKLRLSLLQSMCIPIHLSLQAELPQTMCSISIGSHHLVEEHFDSRGLLLTSTILPSKPNEFLRHA